MKNWLEDLNKTLGLGLILAFIVFLIRGYYGILGEISFWAFLFRWIHVVFGILWIGLLYYFNFVQIPSMPKVPDEQKPAITKVIAPGRAVLFPLGSRRHRAVWPAHRRHEWLSRARARLATSRRHHRHRHVARHYHGRQRLVRHLAEPEEGAGPRRRQRRGEEEGGTHCLTRVAHQHHVVDSHALLHGRPEAALDLSRNDPMRRAGPGLQIVPLLGQPLESSLDQSVGYIRDPARWLPGSECGFVRLRHRSCEGRQPIRLSECVTLAANSAREAPQALSSS